MSKKPPNVSSPGRPDANQESIQRLLALANRAIRAGDSTGALDYLREAHELKPDDLVILLGLGLAHEAKHDLGSAERMLRIALQKQPDFFVARLNLGNVLRKLGRDRDALVTYFRAITTAQLHGQWRNDATTIPSMRRNVLEAMQIVATGRRLLFAGVLDELSAQYGLLALRRMERCLAAYLLEVSVAPPDPKQKPKFLYFPDLPAQRYFSPALFPWLDQFERTAPIIREELQAVMSDGTSLEPFLETRSPGDLAQLLGGRSGPPTWDAFFFYRHGKRYDENSRRCPRTSAILENLPLVRIREHAPEICFSVLTPGTHILPHHGVTNTRVVVHLPLIVPNDCALDVAGDLHAWEEGRCVIFDDTYEHAAWNRSESTRVVLLMDTWNPYLTDVERVALTRLVETIGDFNRASEADA